MSPGVNRTDTDERERLRRLQAYVYPTPLERRLCQAILWCYGSNETHPKGRARIIEACGDGLCWLRDRLVERRLRRGKPC